MEHFRHFAKEGYQLGRVVQEHKHLYEVETEHGEMLAHLKGKFTFEAKERSDYPAVGDWVIINILLDEKKAVIHHVLPRISKLSRQAAGETTEEQVIAANVDTVFFVLALNNDFNVRRMERYMTMIWESGASPVIVLSKSDLCEDIPEKIKKVEVAAMGVPICVVSSVEEKGLEQLAPFLKEGKTIAVTGSSGAGKSTLLNTMYGEKRQKVNDIRESDHKGKHTTTNRELFLLPNGTIVMDTPGMRELKLWESDEDIMDHTFSDIEQLALQCKYHDCSHQSEPGCAVQQAIEDNTLNTSRYQSYVKLQRELAYIARKSNKRAQLEERKKWKKISGDRTTKHRM
ncbi:ribosome small subunit-dependent GTPase A [Longirhabdus pacifica]|uniref:ribosome small subunit-dependent GTPase A n=1 Tax=Longirhabdus pacifica TaxID=2305227 RepID=UPI001008AD2E|nr:ribosome small subunit-dependent GTPase A [Longirhabdus pacifica]